MDEEQEILQSSLQQSDKISIGSFFGSPIGGLANRAISQSNTSLKSSITNRNLIATLQASIELLRGQLQQITNYVLIDRQERSRIIKQRETEAFEREDAIQKGLVRPESVQPRGLEDSLPFFPEARFSEGLTAGMSSIGERQGVAQFQERFVEGSRSFFFGGLVPGSGNADTVNAKLTPGEFVVPKKTVENFSSNFFDDLSDTQSISTSEEATLQGGKVVSGNMSQSDAERNKKIMQLEDQKFDEQMISGYNSPESNKIQKEIMMLSGTPEEAIYTDKKGNLKVKGYSTYDGKTTVDGDEEKKENKLMNFVKGGGLVGALGRKLFGGDKKNENVRNNDKNVKFNTYEDYDDDFSDPFFDDGVGFDELINDDSVKSGDKRGLFGAIGGTIDAATGNLTDFDKRGGKPFGLMRGITGSIDAATGGLTDLDRRGGKPFGLMRGITGSIDAMTGGLTDLDRRGGKPFGTMRLATGVADAMTGNLFDFDRRGDGKEKNTSDVSGRLTRKDFKNDEDFEFYKNNFDDFDDKQLQNKKNQLSMDTTVNPDGSITSKGSGTFIAGEIVRPGESLSPKQRAAITMGIQMGNTYSSEIMENYNNSGGSPSKEEFDNYEKEKSKDIRPEEEKSKNLKPEQTLGERFMNIFRGKDEELTKGFSTYPSVEPASQNNLKVDPSESIKTAAQGLMAPPPPPQSETIELPPQTQGDAGGIDGPSGGVAPFKPSTPKYDPISGTESPLIFVEVISNPFLSIP